MTDRTAALARPFLSRLLRSRLLGSRLCLLPDLARTAAPAVGSGLLLAAAATAALPAIGGRMLLWQTLAMAAALGWTLASWLRQRSPLERRVALLAAVGLAFAIPATADATAGLGGGLIRSVILGGFLSPLAAAVLSFGRRPLGVTIGVSVATLVLPFAAPYWIAAVGVGLAVAFPQAPPASRTSGTQPVWLAFATAALGGLAFAASLRLLLLWTPASLLTVQTVLLAIAVAAAVRVTLGAALVGLAIAAGGLLLIEPLALRVALTTTATVDSVFLLAGFRITAGVLLLLAPAVALTRASAARPAVSLVAALAVAASLAVPVDPVAVLLTAGFGALLISAVIGLMQKGGTLRRQLVGPALAVPSLAAAVAFGGVSHAKPAALLYSGSAFAATRGGLSLDEVAAAMEPRCVAVESDSAGTLTAWTVDGLQIALRENGLPVGTLTIDPRLAPADVAATLAAAIPLAAHPNPDRVAIVGLAAGESAIAVTRYPVRSIAVVEAQSRQVAIEGLLGARGEMLRTDERTVTHDAAPHDLDSVAPLRADVIILSAAQPSLLGGAGLFDTRHFRRVARHLNEGGLIAQRLQTPDLTAESLAALVATLDECLADVAIVQNGSSEILLLAGDLSTIDADALASRMSQPHARAVLADAGLDWASVLEARWLDVETTRRLAAMAEPRSPGKAANERLLPLELMDWTPKWRRHLALWRDNGTPLIEQIDTVELRREAIARVDDLRKRTELLRDRPDQYWAYRGLLRERLQKRPRAKVQQVKGELIHGLHPEDAARKDYLVALSEATRDPTPAAIDRLDRFAEPFDPLVSYFLHGEAGHLNREAGRPGRALSHLTHQIAFGGPDPSVRPLLDAMAILIDSPELIDDPTQRYDFASGLLTRLHHRWNGRVAAGIESQLEGFDLEDSITLSRRMIDRLDEWSADAGTESHWSRRRSALRSELLAELRGIAGKHIARRQQLARLKAKLQTQQAEENGEAEPITR